MAKIDLGLNIKNPRTVAATAEGFYRATDSEHTRRICAELADALEMCRRGEMSADNYKEMKRVKKTGCQFYTPHAHFAKGYKRSDGEPVDSGKAVIDLDGCEHFAELYAERLKGRERELGIDMVNRSVSGTGGHVLFEIPQGMTREQAQAWMAAEMGGVNYDKAVHELERAIFIPCRDYILYIDEELMFGDEVFHTTNYTDYTNSGLVETAMKPTKEEEEIPSNPLSEEKRCFKGIPYGEIIAEYWRRTGGEPVEGERNDRLHKLAGQLRYITDNNEATLMAIMPRYGLSESEMQGLIHSACTGKFYSMPKLMQEIIKGLAPSDDSLQDIPLSPSEGERGAALLPLPALPKRLPPLIRLLVSRTPDIYQPAVAHAVFPSLGAHLHRVQFRYIDNVLHEATLMNVLMAGTGAGKDCISAPINRIMADIRVRDEENLERERQWKREVTSKGANKDKRQRPEGLVIQEIDADMTSPAFVMRMAEADGHFLYTKMNEIEQFDALRGSGRGGQQFQIMCLSFDPDNRYGQTRVGVQSVTEKVTVRFNWNATTTILKGQRYFQNVLTDGPVSRINFCTIPEREIGAPMPVYGTYDADFDEQLRPYIDNLVKAQGVVDCPQAVRLAKKLVAECADFSALSQSRVYENLSFRANVIAYLKACVLYVAHGMRWSRDIEDFVRWSLRYDMACKMLFFGSAIAEANSLGKRDNKRGPRNLLELLRNDFTLQDVIAVRHQQGMSQEGTNDMIRQWRNRGYIEQRTDGQLDSFRKLKYRDSLETANH